MRKRILTLLAAIVLVAVLSCTAFAAELQTFTSGDYIYTVLDDDTVKITKYTGNASVVSIPSKLDGKTVSVIGEYAFNGNNSIKSLTVSGTVTELENKAIHMCEKIETITISDGKLTSIDGLDIENCYALKTLYVPDTVEKIGVLMGCTALENIIIDENNPYLVSVYGVVYSKDMKAIVKYPQGKKCTAFLIPSTVTHINSNAFYEVSKNIDKIYIHTGVKTIDEHAFAYSNAEIHYEGIKVPDAWKNALEGRTVFSKSQFLRAPACLIASSWSGDGRIQLNWDAVPGARGYRIFVKNKTTGKWDIAINSTGAKKVIIEGYGVGSYTFAVRAYSVVGSQINWASRFSTASVVNLRTPQKIGYTVAAGNVVLDWSKVEGVTGYRIFVRNDDGWKALKTTGETSYTATGLEHGTTYLFAVRPYLKYEGKYHWADSCNFIHACISPAVVTTFRAKSISPDSVTLSWYRANGATGYRVFMWNSEKKTWEAVVKATGKNTAVVNGLEPGKSYIFAVRPYSNTGKQILWAKTYTKLTATTKM